MDGVDVAAVAVGAATAAGGSAVEPSTTRSAASAAADTGIVKDCVFLELLRGSVGRAEAQAGDCLRLIVRRSRESERMKCMSADSRIPSV